MAKFSTNGAGWHEAGPLGMSRGGSVAKRADILWALGADMFSGLTLQTSYHCGGGGFRVGDDNRISAGSRLHNHLQSSGERDMSSAHSRSTSSVNPSPATLSQRSVATISFPCGKGGCSRAMGEGVGSSGHLGGRVDDGIHGGQGFGRG